MIADRRIKIKISWLFDYHNLLGPMLTLLRLLLLKTETIIHMYT